MADVQLATGAELSVHQQMIDSITGYAVIRLDANGLVASWHDGAEQVTGYRAEEIIGRPVSVFRTEEDVAAGRAAADLRTASETGRHEAEGWLVRRDGSFYWATMTLAPTRGRDGILPGYVLVARDVTDRREQELALRGVEQMLDAITDYEVIRLDRDGIVRSWNPGARNLKGYTEDEADVFGHDPAVVAATLHRDHARERDDATVVVVRPADLFRPPVAQPGDVP